MTPDDIAEEMLAQTLLELEELATSQKLLHGYLAALRQLPAYLRFSLENPEYGNSDLAKNIVNDLEHFILTGNSTEELVESVRLLDKQFIPDMDDFPSASDALEGALGLIFLHRYIDTNDANNVYELFRGRIECILMTGSQSDQVENLLLEDKVRKELFSLIEASESITAELLSSGLTINEKWHDQAKYA